MNLGALIPEAFKFPGNLSISEIYFSLSVAYFINFGQVFQYVEKHYESTYAMKEEYYKIKDIYYEYEGNVVRLYKELEKATSIEKQILDMSQKGNQQEILTNEQLVKLKEEFFKFIIQNVRLGRLIAERLNSIAKELENCWKNINAFDINYSFLIIIFCGIGLGIIYISYKKFRNSEIDILKQYTKITLFSLNSTKLLGGVKF